MRKKYKYSYNIYDQPDDELFYKQCAALEKHIPNLTKEYPLQDVDGSLIQIYYHEKGEIVVFNDYDIRALYVDSDFDLEPYFE